MLFLMERPTDWARLREATNDHAVLLAGHSDETLDGAADGRRKIMALARKASPAPGVVGVFDAAELGLALGLENVIHTAFLAGRAAERWAEDVRRLAGFSPLLPEDWREEPVEAKREP